MGKTLIIKNSDFSINGFKAIPDVEIELFENRYIPYSDKVIDVNRIVFGQTDVHIAQVNGYNCYKITLYPNYIYNISYYFVKLDRIAETITDKNNKILDFKYICIYAFTEEKIENWTETNKQKARLGSNTLINTTIQTTINTKANTDIQYLYLHGNSSHTITTNDIVITR